MNVAKMGHSIDKISIMLKNVPEGDKVLNLNKNYNEALVKLLLKNTALKDNIFNLFYCKC